VTSTSPAAAATSPALTGWSIVAGAPVRHADDTPAFRPVNPATGDELERFRAATAADVQRAGAAAWEAFYALQACSRDERAALLRAIARRIEGLGDALLARAGLETGLGYTRLAAERDRTVFTLRLFADVAAEGSWPQACIDHGDAARRPLPKPDVRRVLRPLGPVAVFGAGNFPLAYSTAGGDTASALAAGCPVIVKGHPGHPGTGELVALAATEAVRECNLHPGTFQYLHAGGAREMGVGQELVTNPCVRAVGFTGSVAGGMALHALAQSRPDPIPVFAEMGSTNPVFLLPQALARDPRGLAERLFASVTASNGQMCTCPGLLFMVKSDAGDAFLRAMSDMMNLAEPAPMLNPRTRAVFARRLDEVMGTPGVELRAGSPLPGHRTHEQAARHTPGESVMGSPVLLRCAWPVFRQKPALHEEVFGPASLVVVCDSENDLLEAASSVQGSLTGSIFFDRPASDGATPESVLAARLQLVLEQRVGRIVFNGVPTGVEVCASMVHGGPFPATNQPHTSAVGHSAITRWCRPVCYQNAPDVALPAELRESNPLRIRRFVDGAWADAPKN
jgi:NADP-dependent aldehyde dehydrogenase